MTKDEKGNALILTLLFVSLMSVFSLALSYGALSEVRAVERFENRIVAFHWAEGAVDQTLVELRDNASYSGVPQTSASNGRASGSFQTTVTATGSPDTYQIAALGTIGANTASYGYQQSSITAVANFSTTSSSTFPGAIFAQTSISQSGDGGTDAYDSRNGDHDSDDGANEGHLISNGTGANTIVKSGDGTVRGNLTAGPGANPSTAIVVSGDGIVTGSRSAGTNAIPVEAVSVPTELTSGGNLVLDRGTTTTLGSGNYWYSSISITRGGRLTLTGSATIYVSGSVTISGDGGIVTAGSLPTNLRINVTTTDAVSKSGDSNLYAAIYAPQSTVTVSGDGDVFGAIVGNVVSHSGDGTVHYDKALAADTNESNSPNQNLRAWSEVSY